MKVHSIIGSLYWRYDHLRMGLESDLSDLGISTWNHGIWEEIKITILAKAREIGMLQNHLLKALMFANGLFGELYLRAMSGGHG